MTTQDFAGRPGLDVVGPVIAWFGSARRPLPWRAADVSPWGILVSEFMLQQTQVDRVIPRWQAWVQRWPTPAALAAATVADALRMWDRLGYPRRARWLHASAVIIEDRHDGEVPVQEADLLALPGVGPYTAAAVRAFAFGLPAVVLDTNVRRVIARAIGGQASVAAQVTAAERIRAAALADHAESALWAAASMELGALVCSAGCPRCEQCPIIRACAWRRAGYPPFRRPERPPSRPPGRFAGSDRQVRGLILAALRAEHAPVPGSVIESTWPNAEQRDRALASLIADGLVEKTRSGRFRLPS